MQNGIVNWKNHTIVELVYNMLHIIKLSKTFWVEAIPIAYYTQNWVSISTKPKTPYEFWTQHKPKINHLRIFGYTCYAHIRSKKWKKWDFKAIKCIFIGYGEQGVKGHKLYDHQFWKALFGYNVTFDKGSQLKVILNSSNNILVFDEDSFVNPTIKVYVEEQIPSILSLPPILALPP